MARGWEDSNRHDEARDTGPCETFDCRSDEFTVYAELTFNFEPVISKINEEHGDAVYPKANDPVLKRVEFVEAHCDGCRAVYTWDTDPETGLEIAHASISSDVDLPDEIEVVPCPSCKATNWAGVATEAFEIDDATLTKTNGDLSLVDFGDTHWGIAFGGSYCHCECKECGEGFPLYSNNWLTMGRIAQNCRLESD